jgi:cerevisin
MSLSDQHPYLHMDLPEIHSIPERDGTPMVWYTAYLDETMLMHMQQDPNVESIVANDPVQIHPIYESLEESSYSEGLGMEDPDVRKRTSQQWGLARVSHRGHVEDAKKQFLYRSDDGQDVRVYVIDTGVNIHHPEFEGRAVYGKSFVVDQQDKSFFGIQEQQNPFGAHKGDPNPPEDFMGHGTHVASSIGGKTFGVAPNATIVAVRVLDKNGSGSMSDVLAGVDWVVRDHLKRGRGSKTIINMSLGAWKSLPVNRAVNGAVSAGIHVVVAAGNDNDDACSYSPASAEDVIAVGATTKEDTTAFFTNYGDCVSVYAPGHEITGAWLGDETKTISGTSMASPHTAGVVAALLSRGPNLSPKVMRDQLMRSSTHNVIKGIRTTEKEPQGMVYTCPSEGTGAMCPVDSTEPKEDYKQDKVSLSSTEESDNEAEESVFKAIYRLMTEAINSWEFWSTALN